MTERSRPPENLRPDSQLRELFLSYFLDTLTGLELADWLRQLGQDARGSVGEKQRRIRAHTNYLVMPPAEFPEQTEGHLAPYSSEHLADLCQLLGVSEDGTKSSRYRRIMREIHYREGWLMRVVLPAAPSVLTAASVLPFLGWFPMLGGGNYEKDFYPIIADELREIFGSVVYTQLPVAHGSTLKIDFHVGDPRGHGVGVEVKMPMSNSDVQRALGQLDQYQQRYRNDLVLFIVEGRLKRESLDFFIEALTRKSIATVVR